jgi:hypothetical protein
MNFTLLILECKERGFSCWADVIPLQLKGEKRPKQDDYHIQNIDKKVTIVLLISFQLSYNKGDKGPYNPIWITAPEIILPQVDG